MSFVILDRDGVINYDSHEYIKAPDEFLILPGALAAIARLNQAGFQVLLATNQSGIGRGYYDLATLEKIHDKLHQELASVGGKITEIFFCPHLPADNCICRKPKPGMFHVMRDKYQLKLQEIYFIGDSICDIEVAQAAKCKPLLVLTGNGEKTLVTFPGPITFPHFKDLAAAAEFIIRDN